MDDRYAVKSVTYMGFTLVHTCSLYTQYRSMYIYIFFI